jgi:membrane protein YqaA with SNARE-associated domain
MCRGERVMTAIALGALVILLVMSFATAVVPMGPPEAMVVALTVAATTSPEWAIAVAVTAAAGQAAGKLLVFLSVRGRVLRRFRLVERLLRNRLLTKVNTFDSKHPRHLAAVVGLSALASVPPLVVVAPMAGSTTMRRRVFLVSAFAGRLGRFSLLAFVPSLLW